MKKFTYLFILGFFIITLSNCNTVKKITEPKVDSPKLELDIIDLGEGAFPKPVGEVSDFELIFTEEQLATLTQIISDFKKETSNEIAIASIKSIGEYENFDTYALDLSNYWGVGQKIKDNGLTIIFSKTLRRIRISTGFGTQNSLTNEICQNTIDQIMIPYFKNEKFYEGIEKGLIALITKWK